MKPIMGKNNQKITDQCTVFGVKNRDQCTVFGVKSELSSVNIFWIAKLAQQSSEGTEVFLDSIVGSSSTLVFFWIRKKAEQWNWLLS